MAPGDEVYDWRIDAPCSEVDPDLWFPENGQNATRARRICRGCEFKSECLQLVLDDPRIQWGVWAGMTIREIDRKFPWRRTRELGRNAWTSPLWRN